MKNWIDSATNRDYWRALVNAALNLRVIEENYPDSAINGIKGGGGEVEKKQKYL